ncbi:unnamed protein product, partial [Cladocopium goreaui]
MRCIGRAACVAASRCGGLWFQHRMSSQGDSFWRLGQLGGAASQRLSQLGQQVGQAINDTAMRPCVACGQPYVRAGMMTCTECHQLACRNCWEVASFHGPAAPSSQKILCKGCMPLVRKRYSDENVQLRLTRTEAFLMSQLEPFTYDPESKLEQTLRLSGHVMQGILEMMDSAAQAIEAGYYLVRYGPLILAGNDIMESFQLILGLAKKLELPAYHRLGSPDFFGGLYYSMGEHWGQRGRVPEMETAQHTVDGEVPEVDRGQLLMLRHLTRLLLVSKESTPTDAQRLLRQAMPGAELVLAEMSSVPAIPSFFLVCSREMKVAYLVMPGTRKLSDLVTDFNATEEACHGELTEVELQTEVNRLRGREAELTAQVASFGAGSAASAGPGSALAQLVQSQKELVDALRSKEQVRLVDNKGLGKPDKFDGTAERFLSWKIKTSSYLASVRKDLREILVWAEDCDHAITADDIDKAFGSQADAIDQVSNISELRRELWDALLMLTEREPFDIVLNTGECGIESWRKLTRRYDPSTGGRKRALLNAILSPARSKMEDLPSNLEKLLDSIRLYERRKDASGNRTMLAEDIKINVIERLVPAELERHLVLNRDRFKTFESMLSEIQSYVEHATGNKIKVVNSQPYDAHGRGDDPMDVGSFGKDAKGKGKGKKGAGGKPGKGNATAEKRTCHNCGRPGHLRADCWAPGGPKHKGTGGKGNSNQNKDKGKGKGSPGKHKQKPKGGKSVNNVEQGEPEAEDWDAADGDDGQQAANGLTLYGVDGPPHDEDDDESFQVDPESEESEASTSRRRWFSLPHPRASWPEEWDDPDYDGPSGSSTSNATGKTQEGQKSKELNTKERQSKQIRASHSGVSTPTLSNDFDDTTTKEKVEVKPPPPVKASSAASTSGSRLVQMLKAALSSQIRKAQEEDPGSGDGQSDAMLAALRNRSVKAPHITKQNISDPSFHDSRYHAEIAKGVAHNVAWRNERLRRRAIVHRRGGVKARAAERIRLDKEWHERFDNPENPEGIVRIEDEDNLDAGIETVVVGKAGQSTVIEFSMEERKTLRQFPDDEAKLLRKDPKKKPMTKRVRSVGYRVKKNRNRNVARKMARKNRPALVLKENTEVDADEDDDEMEEVYIEEPDEPRDRPGRGDPDGGAGSAPAAVYSLGASDDWRKWERAELNIDTGAAITAVPLDFAKDYPRSESNGASYKAANAEPIEDQGSVKLVGYDESGNKIPIDCRVADVHRPLLSGSEIAKNYHIALGPSSGRLIPRNTPAGRAYSKAMKDLIRDYGDSMPIVHNRRGVRPQINAVGEDPAVSAGADAMEDGGDVSAASAGAGSSGDVPAASAGADAFEDEVDLEIGEEQRKAIVKKEPHQPSQAEVDEHESTGHVVHRSWCLHCKRARVTADRHVPKELDEPETQLPTLSLDYFYMNQDQVADEATLPSIVVKCHKTKRFWASVLPGKGADAFAIAWLGGVLDDAGFNKVILKSDGEPSLVSLKQKVKEIKTHIEVHLVETPVEDHQANGFIEVGVREIKRQCRALLSDLEFKLERKVDPGHPLLVWLPRHAAFLLTRYRVGTDGKTAFERTYGRKWRIPLVRVSIGMYVGTGNRNSDVFVMTERGIMKGNSIHRRPPDDQFKHDQFDSLRGLLWRLQEREHGGLRIALPDVAAPRERPAVQEVIPRNLYVTKNDLEKHGHTPLCPGCEAAILEMPSRAHNAECRQRIQIELDKTPEGQARIKRARERVAQGRRPRGAAAPPEGGGAEGGEAAPPVVPGGEVEQPVLQDRVPLDAEMDASEAVGEPLVDTDFRGELRQREQEREGSPKRQKQEQSRGEKRSSQVDVEDLYNESSAQASGSAGPPAPDASSGVPEGAAAAPTSPETNQEMLHLCSLLKDVIAKGKVAEIFSPPRVAAQAQVVGLAPGFSIDLETKRGDGTHWDLSKDEHIRDLFQLLDYEKPEFLGGSPPCGPFSKLQSIVDAKGNVSPEVRAQRLKDGRKHLRTAVSAYEHQMNAGRYFYHEHPKGAASWEERAVKRLRADERVYEEEFWKQLPDSDDTIVEPVLDAHSGAVLDVDKVRASSTLQSTISLSSGEAEYYSIVRGVSIGMSLQEILRGGVTGYRVLTSCYANLWLKNTALIRLYTSGYRITLLGHSLGAGVGALLTLILRPHISSLCCYGFGTPACVDENLMPQLLN